MRKFFGAVLVAVVLAASPLVASGGSCNGNLCAWLDGVTASGTPQFVGWSLNTTTGLPAASIKVWRTALDGTGGVWVECGFERLPRTDVMTAYGAGTARYTGYKLTAVGQASGTYIYTLLITDGPYAQGAVQISETITIP